MRRPAVQAALEAVYRAQQERIAWALERALECVEDAMGANRVAWTASRGACESIGNVNRAILRDG